VPPASDEEHPSLIEQVKLHVAETAKAFRLDMWLARHTPEKVMPRLHKVIDSMKAEFADALASGGGLYAVGYCFGGKYVLLLGQARPRTSPGAQDAEDHEAEATEEAPVIKAGALAHGTAVLFPCSSLEAEPTPSMLPGQFQLSSKTYIADWFARLGTLVTIDDIKPVKAPVSMVCTGSLILSKSHIKFVSADQGLENDQLFPDEVREEGKGVLKDHGVEHEITVYPNVPHGKLSVIEKE
jgi:hypothetical protein